MPFPLGRCTLSSTMTMLFWWSQDNRDFLLALNGERFRSSILESRGWKFENRKPKPDSKERSFTTVASFRFNNALTLAAISWAVSLQFTQYSNKCRTNHPSNSEASMFEASNNVSFKIERISFVSVKKEGKKTVRRRESSRTSWTTSSSWSSSWYHSCTYAKIVARSKTACTLNALRFTLEPDTDTTLELKMVDTWSRRGDCWNNGLVPCVAKCCNNLFLTWLEERSRITRDDVASESTLSSTRLLALRLRLQKRLRHAI